MRTGGTNSGVPCDDEIIFTRNPSRNVQENDRNSELSPPVNSGDILDICASVSGNVSGTVGTHCNDSRPCTHEVDNLKLTAEVKQLKMELLQQKMRANKLEKRIQILTSQCQESNTSGFQHQNPSRDDLTLAEDDAPCVKRQKALPGGAIEGVNTDDIHVPYSDTSDGTDNDDGDGLIHGVDLRSTGLDSGSARPKRPQKDASGAPKVLTERQMKKREWLEKRRQQQLMQASAQPKLKPMCELFLRGTCASGGECTNSHDLNLTSGRGPLCRFHMHGRCQKGDMCPFNHETKHVPCRFHISARGCVFDDVTCPCSHSPLESEEEKQTFISDHFAYLKDLTQTMPLNKAYWWRDAVEAKIKEDDADVLYAFAAQPLTSPPLAAEATAEDEHEITFAPRGKSAPPSVPHSTGTIGNQSVSGAPPKAVSRDSLELEALKASGMLKVGLRMSTIPLDLLQPLPLFGEDAGPDGV